MNKRIVLIDQKETPEFMKYFGIGLGNDIYTIQQLEDMSEADRDNILELSDTDGVLIIGSKPCTPFKFLQARYHFGIRNENFLDCSRLKRFSIHTGAYGKVVTPDSLTNEDVDYFMSPEFTQHRDFSWFKHKVIHTYKESMKFLFWLSKLPEDTNFGFDYEGSGMPLDKYYELSGASICNIQYGGFISFTDLRHNSSEEQYSEVLSTLASFLLSRQDKIWTYNMQYEFQVSKRMLGVDLYNLRDSSVFNILSGDHLKKYSLKWSGNKIGTRVWDYEFDYISDLVDSMLFEVIGETKKEQQKILKVTKDNFKDTVEWATLCKKYPDYVNEFEALILEYWGNPFMCIPSDILGHYCNLDAFYTLMIYEDNKDLYSQKAIDTFSDNIRLACRLHSCGIPKWEDYRLEYQDYCKKQMAWGITYCAMSRIYIKMTKHQKLMGDINRYSTPCQILLRKGMFCNGNTLEIAKLLLTTNLDTLDAYDTGINEGQLFMTFGDWADDFMRIIRESIKEAKFKGKIDKTIVKKRKILGIIAEKLIPSLGLDKKKLGPKSLELEKYLYYFRAFEELSKITSTQMTDIFNIPSEIYVSTLGYKLDLLDYSEYIQKNYFMCKSPEENDIIASEFIKLYPLETSWLAALTESTQQLDGAEKFFENQGISDINQAYEQFLTSWETWCKSGGVGDYEYPEKVYYLALDFWRNPEQTVTKEVWTNIKGYTVQSQFFKEFDSQYESYGTIFSETDYTDKFFFMRKFVLNYLLYKKYAKILSTYIDGMFLKSDITVIEDPVSHVSIREADPTEPGAITKMFPRFQCMEKSSKRWSSGYHTIISHSDIKSTIRSYPGHLLSYFDISSAEVKSAGFASGDPDLIDKFVKGIDIYVYTGKLYLPDGPWDTDPDFKKMWRKRFKTIFLGILYGLGKKSLAERLNCSEAEAEHIIESVYQAFPKLREYVASQQAYPFTHDGCINTFFGDRLVVDEWKYYLKASEREKNYYKSRIERLGVNLPIQGGTSTAMSSGFFNDLRVASESGWSLTSFITVHDSNTCDFPAHKLWGIRGFYDHNFTDFCYDKTGIKLLFDLEIGCTYQDSCSMKQLSPDVIELSGNARSLQMIMERMDEDPECDYEINVPRESIIPEYITHPIDRFIREKGCSMVKDISKYKVQFTKK